MITKLSILSNLYMNKKEKVTFNTDNSEIIEFDDKVEDDFIISISMNKIDDSYYVFVFAENDKKLIFKGLYKKNKIIIDDEYNKIKEDLYTFNLENFIEKYYESLKNNFK